MAVQSIGPSLGAAAPDFDLPIANPWVDDDTAPTRSLAQYSGSGLVVVFTCNHCPYAIHVQSELVKVANEYMKQGVHFVAINANDPEQFPDDSFERMAERARAIEFPFPYLFDESQEVAKAYKAACTPDFFVFDKQHKLIYGGRFDETRPGQSNAHGRDLRNALDRLLADSDPISQQYPSIGCSIKWKPGNEPVYS